MAFIYTRKRSPFYWLRFRDPLTGEVVAQSTGLRVGNAHDKRAAAELEAQKTLAERETGRPARNEAWAHWVRTFLATHYSQNEGSLTRYSSAWRNVELYLKEMKIAAPRNLTREHCLHYFEWRKTPDIKNGKYRAGHNTALLDIKVLCLVMKEAVRRGLARENPARDLGVRRAPRKLRPEFTDEIYDVILAAIKKGVAPLIFSSVVLIFPLLVIRAFTFAPCATSFLTSSRLVILPEPTGAGSLPGFRTHVI